MKEVKRPQGEIARQLKVLMLLRVVFISLLLGAFIFVLVKQQKPYSQYVQTFHYLLIAAVYFLTFFYVLVFKYAKTLVWLVYIQFFIDVLIVTAIVFATGGIESIFSFLYIFVIFGGSIILYRRGGIAIASISSIFYGLLLDLQYFGVIHPLGIRQISPSEYQSFHIFYQILVNIAAFYMVAILSSFLSEQARQSRAELKARQSDIEKLEALNESIIKSIKSALIVLDHYDRIILFNPAAEEILEMKADAATGHPIDESLPFLKDYLSQLNVKTNERSKKGRSFIDFPYSRGKNQEIYLRLSVSPLGFRKKDEKGLILILQDLTESRKIEEEMKKVEGLALVGQLAAGIAHEIRNPMASISGSIQMLKRGLDEDDVNARLMDIVSREINRLNHLISDFLFYARPKTANFSEFNLNQVISESLTLFRNNQDLSDRIKIVTDLDETIDLRSDPAQIKQALWNLLLNARDAMSEGGTLHISTEKGPNGTEQEMVRITVRDTGTGFNHEALSKLFTPFYTTKEEGSGLGLATVKRIVEGLHGEITGSNHPEGGAQILMSFPLCPRHMPSNGNGLITSNPS
ncbi:MAG: ATP-binding protein [Desulfatiglans sp.]|jgi:two-component system sensor histidine kinase PilS (NtrC family)|nr:ATP-binding protein [Thermodesulfobacteriota bacterium]MEE4354576.1 ATP-binding protein [Desulfatiglans sp.]